MTIGPLDWFAQPVNWQGLSFSYGVTIMSAGCVTVLDGATWSTVTVGVVSAIMFTTITVPLVDLYWGLIWPWWLVIAAGWGVSSVLALRTMQRAAKRIYNRTDDIVDGGIRRIQPTTPEPKP